jgi:hypothetical protein
MFGIQSIDPTKTISVDARIAVAEGRKKVAVDTGRNRGHSSDPVLDPE